MFQKKAHPLLQKLIVIFLALVVVLTYMPSTAFAGEWRTGDTAYFKSILGVLLIHTSPFVLYYACGRRKNRPGLLPAAHGHEPFKR